MKKTLFSVALLAAATQALAFNEKQAVALTQKFLSTVACAYDESTFPVVKLDDDSYLVGWTGQLRCPGGNGTTVSYLTAVAPGYVGEDTYVVDYHESAAPDVGSLHTLDKLSFQNGVLLVNGRVIRNKESKVTLKFLRDRGECKKIK